MSEIFTFDRFVAGQELGVTEGGIDERLFDVWQALYPWDGMSGGKIPVGMVSALIMRAYLGIVTPRPPGNVHTGMEMTVHTLPAEGSILRTSVRCAATEEKGERKFVDFATVTTDAVDGTALFDGILRLIWAR